MCGSIQQAARKKLTRLLTDMGIPQHIIIWVTGGIEQWPQEDGPPVNLLRNSALVVFRQEDGHPTVEIMRWGMLPQWKRDAGDTMPLINARSETVFTTRSFKSAAQSRRCVVFCEAFYEPRVEHSTAPHARYRFYSAHDQLLAIAAIWSPSEIDDKKELCLLTTKPNVLVGTIHDRMPVLLDAEGVKRWCDPTQNESQLLDLFLPAPVDELIAEPVQKKKRV
jgi:putative SOS response-associated peptidase YedK